MQHFTIATSSGIVWLTLICHFGAAAGEASPPQQP